MTSPPPILPFKQQHGFCRAKSPHSKHKKDKSNRVQLVFFVVETRGFVGSVSWTLP